MFRHPPTSRLRAVLLFVLFSFVTVGHAGSVEVPITFDQAFMTRLLEQKVFTESDHSLSVWGDEPGCNDITVSNPTSQYGLTNCM